MSERKQRIEDWLASSRRFLLSCVRRVPESDWSRVVHTDQSNWTARDLLAHIAGAEPSMLAIIGRMQAESRYVPRADFDLDYWNRRQVEKRAAKTPEDLLSEMETNRAVTLRLLAELSDDTLDLLVQHPAYGEMTVEDIFRVIGFHERLHGAELPAPPPTPPAA